MATAPPSQISAMEGQLIASIQENLAMYLLENAIFLGERLVADFPSEANVYLLASSYHRAKQSYRAYHLLNGLQGPQSRYLFALCCMELGHDKLTEAEMALMPNNDMSKVPNGAAGYHLLGRIHQLSNRHSAAIAFYSVALQLDPMLWSAYEELCVLGADHETEQYVANHEPAFVQQPMVGTGAGVPQKMPPGSAAPVPPPNMPGAAALTPTLTGFQQQNYAPPPGFGPLSGGGWSTGGAAAAGGQTMTPHGVNYITPSPLGGHLAGPPPVARDNNAAAAWQLNNNTGGGPATGGILGGPLIPESEDRNHRGAAKPRKVSSKLFADPSSVLRRGQLATTGAGVSPADSEALMEMSAVAGVPRGERSAQGQAAAVALLQLLGEGYRLLCMYRCREAIDAFSRLPARQYQTGWVLNHVARAHFEMVNYQEAAKTFSWSREIDPYRLKGLEYYSTVLWHMKSEVQLSSLAKDAIALDRESPYAWCVMGNCFSLQKEHETALRYFQRALQLDPTIPYAYTLCGHEYFANEDFEKGISCYRNAIRIDPRHYNAWFGMGHIYQRQEKYSMAEYHFRRALAINERSSVLRCYLGMALHKLKRNAEALEALQGAIVADPHNPLARFEKATVLQAEERHQEALQELQALRSFAPREASVLFQMGKLYKKLGWVQEALSCFNAALDLQPPSSDTNVMKAAIDRIGNVGLNEEDDDI